MRILICLLFSAASLSCSKEVLDEATPHLITTQSLYGSYDGLVSGINGLYASVRQEREGIASDPEGFFNGNHLRAELWVSGVDNVVPNLIDVAPPTFSLIHSNWANFNNSFHGQLEEIFLWLYSIVNASNTIINNASNRSDINWGSAAQAEERKNYILSEAFAIRAWAYRHLSYGWGDVPLNLQESDGANIISDWERAPLLSVRRQIISDLKFAEQYINTEPATPGKLTKGAIQTYLAEMYLAINNADSALYWSNQVVNNSAYAINTIAFGENSSNGNPFMSVLYDRNAKRTSGNKESLWTLEFEFGIPGGSKSIMRRWNINRHDQLVIGGIAPFRITPERGGRGIARTGISKYALDLYEPQDFRFAHEVIRKYLILNDASQNSTGVADRLPAGYNYGDTIWYNTTSDITRRGVYNWPHTRKFESVHPETDAADNWQYDDQVYMRLAETYLLKAEAEFKLGQLTNAANTLNVLRDRANASLITPDQVTLDFILDERSRELIYEEHRRWTLLRTRTWLQRVNTYNKNGGSTATARDTLFPIPQRVIDANLTSPMRQNPGF